jgi:hypothetical protein
VAVIARRAQRRATRSKLRRVRARRAAGVLVTIILAVAVQPAVKTDRWWMVPHIVAALHITPEQTEAIERSYERNVPEGCRVSLEVVRVTQQIDEAIANGVYDDSVLRLTEQLANARFRQNSLRRRMLTEAVGALQQQQHAQLSRLIADDTINGVNGPKH